MLVITKGGIYTPINFNDTPETRIEYVGLKDGELCFRFSFRDSGEEIFTMSEFIFFRNYKKSNIKDKSNFNPNQIFN